MDEELRRLEPEVASGELHAKLQLVRMLERAGRLTEARELVARTPGFCGAFGDSGRSRYIDVEPIRVKPGILWQSGKGGVPKGSPEIASELGVFVRDGEALVALEPDTADRRFVVNGVRPKSWLGGGCLLVPTETAEPLVVSACTGARLAEFPRGGGTMILGLADGTWLSSEEGGSVLARRRSDGSTVFSTSVPARGSIDEWRLTDVIATPDCILVKEGDGANSQIAVVDATTGDVVRRVPGRHAFALDRNGFAVQPLGSSVLHEADGRALYLNDLVAALAPDFVVTVVALDRMQIRDRATGHGVIGLDGFDQVSAVRGVIYRSVGAIVEARQPDGTLLWAFDAGTRVSRLLPFARRLVLGVGGGVMCLGERADWGPPLPSTQ